MANLTSPQETHTPPRKEDQEAKLRQKMTWKFRELDEEVAGLGASRSEAVRKGR